MLIPRFEIKNTFLCSLTEDSWGYFLKWLNDDNLLVYMGDYDLKPFTERDAKQYTQAHLKDSWLICTKEKGELLPIGFCGAFIKTRHDLAIIRIVIGESEFLGKGHAYRAMTMLQDWLFNQMNIHVIHLTVDSRNTGAIKLYCRLGFNHCGTYCESRKHSDGTRSDEYCMELIKNNKQPAQEVKS